MNQWDQKKEMAIVEADDFQDRWDRNGLNFLFAWKAKYPKFKITLYTIPDRTSVQMLKLIQQHMVHDVMGREPWIELAVHGWNHESNFECYGWNYERTQMFMKRVTDMRDQGWQSHYYTRNFKAPGWTITPGYNGYPAAEKDAINEDPQAVYRALTDMDFMICDRHYNHPIRPENSKIICIDCNPDIVHFHTWNVPSADPNGKNGFQDVEEAFGVPWDENTEFYFMSEAWEKGLYRKCSKL